MKPVLSLAVAAFGVLAGISPAVAGDAAAAGHPFILWTKDKAAAVLLGYREGDLCGRVRRAGRPLQNADNGLAVNMGQRKNVRLCLSGWLE